MYARETLLVASDSIPSENTSFEPMEKERILLAYQPGCASRFSCSLYSMRRSPHRFETKHHRSLPKALDDGTIEC